MPPTAKLTTHEIHVVNWVEQIHLTTGGYPTQEEYEEHFPEAEKSLKQLLLKPLFKRALMNRGVIPDEIFKLSAEQLAAIAAFADSKDIRTTRNRLRTVGVSTYKWNSWMRDPRFKKEVQKIIGNLFDDSLHLAQLGILKGLEEGNINAIKFYYEVTGEYGGNNSQGGEVADLKLIIARLTEVLQIHIADSEVLGRIYRDFETVLHGRRVVPEAERVLGIQNSEVPEEQVL